MARPRVRGFWFVLVAAGGLAGSLPAVADAASPGRNGRIAYVQMRSTWLNSFAGTTVYSIAPSGTRRRAIVHLGEAAGATAAFSPRGGWIAYASTYAEPLGGLFLMRANGRDRRRLTPAPSTDTLLFTDATPAFAPDGKRIAFSRTYWTGPSSGTGVRIYDRGRSRLLVTDAYDPSWSVRTGSSSRAATAASGPSDRTALAFTRSSAGAGNRTGHRMASGSSTSSTRRSG